MENPDTQPTLDTKHMTLREDKQRKNKTNKTMHQAKKMSITYYTFDFQAYALVYYPCELYTLATLYYY